MSEAKLGGNGSQIRNYGRGEPAALGLSLAVSLRGKCMLSQNVCLVEVRLLALEQGEGVDFLYSAGNALAEKCLDRNTGDLNFRQFDVPKNIYIEYWLRTPVVEINGERRLFSFKETDNFWLGKACDGNPRGPYAGTQFCEFSAIHEAGHIHPQRLRFLNLNADREDYAYCLRVYSHSVSAWLGNDPIIQNGPLDR